MLPKGIVAAFVLVASSVVFSHVSGPQSTETRTDAVGATRQAAPADPCATKAKVEHGQVDVLSDTQGVDFGPYLTKVVKGVRESWYSVIPPSAHLPTKKQGRVAIGRVARPCGGLSSLRLRVPHPCVLCKGGNHGPISVGIEDQVDFREHRRETISTIRSIVPALEGPF